MKQLFDVSSILDLINKLEIVNRTFQKLVPIELGYRGLDTLLPQDVLNDAYETAMNICLYGALNKQEYNYLVDGVQRVNGFILIKNYTMKRTIRDAAKLAYLVRLIELGINEVSHYAKEADTAMAVNHWFQEDEIAVSMLFKFANAMGATLQLLYRSGQHNQ